MDLAVLRTARAALDEGLINAEDFDAVKGAFVRAQSIKAGRDAGFIMEADFAEARGEFFRAMGMSGLAPAPAQPRCESPSSPSPAPRFAEASRPTAPPSSLSMPPLRSVSRSSNGGDSALGSARGVPSPTVSEAPYSIQDFGGAAATAGKVRARWLARPRRRLR